MRIYAVADIHGKTEYIDTIKAVINHKKPDLLIIAGDIINYVSPLKTLNQLNDMTIPVLGVRGNSDLKSSEKYYPHQKNISLLNHVPYTFQDRHIIGLNGTIPLPFLSKICFRENERLKTLENSITPETILVSHPPPRGICDKAGNKFSAGSYQLRTFIDNHPPFILLCGHIHEQAGYQYLNKTLVVNCAMNKKYSGAIIDIETDRSLRVNMIINAD